MSLNFSFKNIYCLKMMPRKHRNTKEYVKKARKGNL